MEKFSGIEQAKKEIENGIKLTLKMVHEIDTAKRGMLSNWKIKNIKLANKIRKHNKLLLYKSCIIKIISTNWIDSIQDVYVQNDQMINLNNQAMEIILKDETRIHCALNIVQQSTVFDYLQLFKLLYYLNLLDEQKVLFAISDEIEKKALSIVKMTRWNIDIRNLKV